MIQSLLNSATSLQHMNFWGHCISKVQHMQWILPRSPEETNPVEILVELYGLGTKGYWETLSSGSRWSDHKDIATSIAKYFC
jgi:hypothetical protein